MKMKVNKLYLVAVSGDLAEGGLSIKAVAIPVDNKHKKIIKEFLMAQQEKYIEFCYWKPHTEYNQEYLNNYYKCFDRLFDVGIFDNKWESRTDWKLVYECDLDLLGFEYQIKKDKKQEFMKLKKNRDLWIMEVAGDGVKPYKTKYGNKRLYVWWEKDDDTIDIYHTDNIYNEVEDETTIEFFNQL